MSDRIKRIIAFVIDWNITLFPFVIIFIGIITFLQQQAAVEPIVGIFCFLLVIAAFAVFVLRDAIFKGRSLGKRMMGLSVYDKRTLQEPTKDQCIVRSSFFLLYPVDGILLLVTGESMGDRAAGTVVLSEKMFEEYRRMQLDAHNPTSIPQTHIKKNRRQAMLIIVAVIGCLIAFIGFIQIILNAQKDTEEYRIAYDYLISSEAFRELDAEESRIRMNQYSSSSNISANGDSVSKTVKIGFAVKFRSFEVVCHKENGAWQVCKECTRFD